MTQSEKLWKGEIEVSPTLAAMDSKAAMLALKQVYCAGIRQTLFIFKKCVEERGIEEVERLIPALSDDSDEWHRELMQEVKGHIERN